MSAPFHTTPEYQKALNALREERIDTLETSHPWSSVADARISITVYADLVKQRRTLLDAPVLQEEPG